MTLSDDGDTWWVGWFKYTEEWPPLKMVAAYITHMNFHICRN